MRKLKASLVCATALCASHAHAQSQAKSYMKAVRYDLAGRVTGTIASDPDGAGKLGYPAERRTYDAAGRLTAVEAGELSSWNDEMVATKDWVGFVVRRRDDLSYDANGRLSRRSVTIDGALDALTQYSYSGDGNLDCTAVRMDRSRFGAAPSDACVQTVIGGGDLPDRIVKNNYDAAGQLLSEEHAYGSSVSQKYASYTYTPNGKKATITDAAGAVSELKYNNADLLEYIYFPSAVTRAKNTSDYERFGYDKAGNKTSIRKRDGRVIELTYDSQNRVIYKHVPVGCAPVQKGDCADGSATRDVYYGFNLVGNATFARFDGKGDASDGVTSGFDAFGDMTTSKIKMGSFSKTVSFSYDANNKRKTIEADGSTWTYDYDILDRLTGVFSGTGTANNLSKISYNWAGLQEDVTDNPTSMLHAEYDGSGRAVKRVDTYIGGNGNTTSNLTYNAADQVTSVDRSNASYVHKGFYAIDRSYTPNGLNQYDAIGARSYSYDMNGNLVSDGGRSYTYDAENRVVGVKNGSDVVAKLTYDPLGRLFSIEGAGGLKQFVYDGDQIEAEYDGQGNLTDRYIRGADGDRPLLWYAGSELRWYHRDHQGSVTAAVSSVGYPAFVNTYDPFGRPGSSNVGRFQFTGQIWLREIGLYYYKARLYSPTLGRFLQVDPIGIADQLNLYSYVNNDPVSKSDPTGLYQCNGAETQCLAVKEAYERAQEALKSGNLTRAQRRELRTSLTELGAPGHKNGVRVEFRKDSWIYSQSGGAAFTDRDNRGIVVYLNDKFSKTYENYVGPGTGFGENFSARDARSDIFVHEGIHVLQRRLGMTDQMYARNVKAYEDPAYAVGWSVHKAFGSQPLHPPYWTPR